MVCHGSQQVAACAPRCELTISMASEVPTCEHADDTQGVRRGPAVARKAHELRPLEEQEHAASLTWQPCKFRQLVRHKAAILRIPKAIHMELLYPRPHPLRISVFVRSHGQTGIIFQLQAWWRQG
eukprot:Skav233660  [mRNA]  locus=scaffold2779:1098737:1099111:+ [translate_table: standard]